MTDHADKAVEILKGYRDNPTGLRAMTHAVLDLASAVREGCAVLAKALEPPPEVTLSVEHTQPSLFVPCGKETVHRPHMSEPAGTLCPGWFTYDPCPMVPRVRCDVGPEHPEHLWGSATGTVKLCLGYVREQQVLLCNSDDQHRGHEWVLRAGCADEERVWCEGS